MSETADTIVSGDSSLHPGAPTLSPMREALNRMVGDRIARICVIVALGYLAAALFSFTPYVDHKIDQSMSGDKTFAPPAWGYTRADGSTAIAPAYWFGLDFEGHSVFWNVLYGSRMALIITVCACAMSISIGGALGLLAGFFGGWVDDIITWLYSTVSSIPWLLLVIAMAYVIQNAQTVGATAAKPSKLLDFLGGTPTIILALGLTDWVGLCRLMRGEVIKLRDLDFVVAARALGLSRWRIIFRHILPNTFHIIIITFSLSTVSYVQVETILAFLGLGITNKPSWGRMIDDSKLELLRGVWWEATAATMAIVILCLALNILGDMLRDALDPKLHGTK